MRVWLLYDNVVMHWESYYREQAHSGFGRSFPFDKHYATQIGGGGFYAGVKRQQGYGLGGVLAKLGRFVLPLLKPIAKSVGKQVIQSGAQFAGDIINGQKPKQAFKQNLKRGAKQLFQKAIKRKTSPSKRVKRKRTVKRASISKAKRSRKQDIFDHD